MDNKKRNWYDSDDQICWEGEKIRMVEIGTAQTPLSVTISPFKPFTFSNTDKVIRVVLVSYVDWTPLYLI